MATRENYMPGTLDMTVPQRTALIMQRLEDVINGSEAIRKECNRIRNEFIGLGMEPDSEFLGLVGHLLIDLVHLRVKAGRMAGYPPAKMARLTYLLDNPMAQLSNEDPS